MINISYYNYRMEPLIEEPISRFTDAQLLKAQSEGKLLTPEEKGRAKEIAQRFRKINNHNKKRNKKRK